MSVTVTEENLEQVKAHAREAYPNECCGILVERGERQEIVRVSNIQDDLHEKDPEQFPRSARTAYTMGQEAVPVLLAAERGELRLLAFYHSHPEHDAYFSAEDRKQAMGGWDEPTYPEAGQIVVSVYAGEVKAVRAFTWKAADNDFADAHLSVS
jgi:proteasome lid subunit RPN8/RPN11